MDSQDTNDTQVPASDGAENATSSSDVVIYSTPVCHFCQAAKEFFSANNIAYTEHDVAADAQMRQEMIDMTGQMGVPVIKIGNDVIIGFDEPKLKELLSL